MAGYKFNEKQKQIKFGPIAVAATSVVGLIILFFAAALMFGGVIALLSWPAMLLFGILHAEVALGIPAFGYWACFWMTMALAFVSSFFRRS